MCHIVASFDFEKALQLVKNNLHRGNSTCSMSIFEISSEKETRLVLLKRESRGFDLEVENEFREALRGFKEGKDDLSLYFVFHTQAPTSASSIGNIHPACSSNQKVLLWHNGIVRKIAGRSIRGGWDTQSMAECLSDSIETLPFCLEKFEGSFACVAYKHNDLFAFANKAAPLYKDNNQTICSTYFDGASPFNKKLEGAECSVYKLDPSIKIWTTFDTFLSIENPFL